MKPKPRAVKGRAKPSATSDDQPAPKKRKRKIAESVAAPSATSDDAPTARPALKKKKKKKRESRVARGVEAS